jgi:hypothetical protein
MSIQQNDNLLHWNYFIALEQDLANSSRYIEFTTENFSVFSIELAHLLLASSSEVDVVLRALCQLKNPTKDHGNINDYKETIRLHCAEFIEERCYVHRFGLELTPWVNWRGENNPDWWRSYNNVKHQRDEHFREANLKNTLNSVAGLELTILYYYKELFSQTGEDQQFRDVTRKFLPESSLIKFNDDYYYHNLIV